MHLPLAFYGGPDQIMGVTSGLAGLIGILMIFWNKIVGAFFRVLAKFRPSGSQSVSRENQSSTSTETL
jgi:hypothetical protein